ncbi:hypothetical protein [Streptomyces sp. NPDC006368]|uniref:hypothetical protein n=1 Tax=Streptomyces sp. NPDC006368 TaxID=3156760 RepID=UPI0033BED7AA
MRQELLRFDGWIAGIGTSSGTRLVLGHWPRSPFGPFSDVMVQRPDGERLLLAPTERTAAFIADVYRFERVLVVPVVVRVEGAAWRVTAGPLTLDFGVGRRSPLGMALRVVPRAVAARPAWAAVTGVPARLLPGVRTRGRTGPGHREWYGARDLRPVVTARAAFGDADLGVLAPVDPPVGFGFGSVPRRPALVRVTTTVALAASDGPAPDRPGGA